MFVNSKLGVCWIYACFAVIFFKLLCLSFVCHIACWLIEIRDLLIRAPPVTFPRVDGKIKKIGMPEDVYVKKFFKKHPDSLYHDAIK